MMTLSKRKAPTLADLYKLVPYATHVESTERWWMIWQDQQTMDGWYQPPIEKFNDKGERFYDEAEAILSRLLQNALEGFQESVDSKRGEVGL